MKSPIAGVNLAALGLAAFILLLPWTGSVAAGERQGRFTETKLLAADGAPGDHFGIGVAISGDTVVIGANEDDGFGAAYVFERDPLNPAHWTQTAKLIPSDGEVLDHFGTHVAISGDVIVIAAEGDDFNSGSAYVFERGPGDSTGWKQTAKLTASDSETGDQFAISVAISGDTVVVGANQDDDFGESSGSAYVFMRDPVDPAVWRETAKLTAGDSAAGDVFGAYVAICGSTAVIGAVGDDDLGASSGSAYVFDRDPLDPTLWTQTAKLTAADGAADDHFGHVAIFGDTVVVGALRDDDLGLDSGSVYVFERDPFDFTDWNQTAKLTATDGAPGDFFGEETAISGDMAVFAAPLDDDRGVASGSAYLFQRDPRDSTEWRQIAKLTASDGAPDDGFSTSVGLDGNTALIGAYRHDALATNAGSAYVYAPQDCKLALALEPLMPRAGEELQVAVDVVHRRPFTVTVPFLLWIEDAAGRVVVQKSSPPVTMEPGDHRQLRLALILPPSIPTGTYRVLVGVRRMQQGIAWASREFHVVE